MKLLESSAVEEMERREEKKPLSKRIKTILIGVALIGLGIVIIGLWGRQIGLEEGETRRQEAIAEKDEVIAEKDGIIVSLNETIEDQQKQIEELLDTPIVVTPVIPEAVLEVAQTEIRSIGELATMEYLYTNAGVYKDARFLGDFELPLTQKTFTMKWNGVIKAGVDISRVEVVVESIADNECRITIYLPQAEILSHELDNDSVEVFNEADAIFNPVTVEDQKKFEAACQEEMETRVIESGVIEKAQSNAEEIISKLLNANPDIAEYCTIIFETIPVEE